ncbi:unnamed protein product [Penicillium salamii]|uniref:Uncharacterized protein n=1 Tax=Penicillium salamii TaxID=1612424 RepID=A0A9W4JPD9_9EURO|nr:unnamed protein product [Penicillium salamii]CAG8133841.1 unnamed protein product [Penicillium salamii]CAG8156205.1 unnamed protein product [Penicillium salamii]CAG8233015.1 unnamed protein product [Penicillium salamii]CAG8288711.1 unnamed protein product [Penicillium salamii]
MESDEALSHVDRPQQSQADDIQPQRADQTTETPPIRDTIAPETAEHDGRSSDSTEDLNSFQEASDFIPLEETPSGYPELDWKPLVLHKWCLLLVIAFFVACLTGLAIIVRVNHTRPELLHVARTPSRLAFKYVPVAAGTITSIWWRSLAQSYLHLIPYISMASAANAPKGRASRANRTIHAVGSLEAFFPTPHSLGRLIKERHILTVITFLTSFLVIPFLTPLKNALFQTIQDPEGWTIHVSNKIACITITLYCLMTASTISILIRLWSVRTGLKWEVASIASQLALVQNSNVYGPFRGLEFEHARGFRKNVGSWHLEYGVLRLGYWKVVRGEEEMIWHGVRFYKPKEAPLNFEGCEVQHPERFRYALVYANHWDSVLAFLLAIGVALFITCIFGICRNIVNKGFDFTPSVPRTHIALVQEILFAFLPALFFNMFCMEIHATAYFYRLLQPIANMENPVSAEESVLLDYAGQNAASATLTAAKNKHWRVAWFNFLDGLSALPFVLIAGAFTAQETSAGWHVTVAPGSFYTLFALLIIYCVSLVLCRPPPEYRTPIMIPTLAELLTLCYDSQILDGNEFSVQDPSDRQIHLVSKVHLAKRKYRFGLYMGRDGRRHLGFDATSEKATECGTPPVYGIEPGWAIYFSFKPLWLRYPAVKYPEGDDVTL